MSRIHSNISALQGIHRLQRNFSDLTLRLERLATGLRINRGADDPAGLIASERLRSEITTLQKAIDNSTRANNVMFVAEGALNEASALLLDLQSLVVEAANEAGLSDAEVRANQLQIDSILDSLDRIANTTQFAGKKLLDGSGAYLTSGVVPTALPTVELFAARLPEGGTLPVRVEVTQSAQTAVIAFVGTNPGGISTTSATTVELRGSLGAELLAFASGTTLAEVRTAINNVREVTGISAVVSAAGGGVASALVLSSTAVGADAFVSVEPIGGNFITGDNNLTVLRDIGVEAGVLINGQQSLVRGLAAEVRSGGLDLRVVMDRTFAQTLSSSQFTITGGGSVFQIGPEVTPNGQFHAGFRTISSTHLGNSVTGLLYTLRSGQGNDLASKSFISAQSIVNEAVEQVAFYRGRIGNVQRNVIEPNISSRRVALENVTASESTIRDADMATEVSALTRAQVLVQTTQTALQIANTVPNFVLDLLR